MESLENAVEECRGQQGNGRQEETPIPCLAVAEPQAEYGAELFEQYQREHGAEQMAEAAVQTVTQEVQKSR